MSPVEIEHLESPAQIHEIVTGALVDGSITYSLGFPDRAERAITLPTPAGESPVFYLLREQGVPFWYVHFHGIDFRNARDNVDVGFTRTWYVLHALGIRDVISGAAAGSISAQFGPKDLVIMDDFVDLSTHRPRSILTAIWWYPPHIGGLYIPPLCPELTDLLRVEAKSFRQGRVFNSGTLCQFEGHRFESPAEIRMAKAIGTDMVAHHQASEAIYSRELGIHYAALDYITNIAAGLATDKDKEFVTNEEAREGYLQCAEIMVNAMVKAASRPVECKVCPMPTEPPPAGKVEMKEVYR